MAKTPSTLPAIPFGSRALRLTWPYLGGTDVWIFQVLYNTARNLLQSETALALPRLSVTGWFDRKSAQAARALQACFGLSPSGEVGRATFRLFGHIPDAYGGPAFGSRPLKLGDTGGDVVVLQNRLNGLRYAALLGHPADGVFATATAAALRAFQADCRVFRRQPVPVDGTLDPKTLLLLEAVALLGGRNLYAGADGVDTAALQTVLANLGFYRGRIDGRFGSMTRQAVMALQARVGQRPDGVVGPATYHRLGLISPTMAYSLDTAPRQSLGALRSPRPALLFPTPAGEHQGPAGLTVVPATAPPPATPTPLVTTLADASGTVTAEGTLHRLSGRTTEIVARSRRAPIGLTVGEGETLWVVSWGDDPTGSAACLEVLEPTGDGDWIGTGDFPWPGLLGAAYNFGPWYGLPPYLFYLAGPGLALYRLPLSDGPSPPMPLRPEPLVALAPSVIPPQLQPLGLCWVPQDDTLYAGDGHGHRVVQVVGASSPKGPWKPVPIFAGKPLAHPAALAFNPDNGHLVVADGNGPRLFEVHPHTGRLASLRTLGGSVVPTLPTLPAGILGLALAWDATGMMTVWATEPARNRLWRFGP
ncbi:MAG: peptidoglycan-binding protein [Firmicutes bacterium]|nr:peptidoglycan-binding protein [Alicyclobacillaceae bacterium]MCL6496223.1 peptidoglycan-binding protein [Bacillota bacterium]